MVQYCLRLPQLLLTVTANQSADNKLECALCGNANPRRLFLRFRVQSLLTSKCRHRTVVQY